MGYQPYYRRDEEKCCGKCRWHRLLDWKTNSWGCENPDGELNGCGTDYDDGCIDWEGKRETAMSKCKSCGAPIFWIKMRTGKSMPVDVKRIHYREDNDGPLNLVTLDGTVVRAVEDPKSPLWGHTSHFVTCPNAALHRKGGHGNEDRDHSSIQ